ncbi:MAG: 2-succinyl-5-enolpyruvyl-6-hydroxy-3-cyclohexene-1-carboxylic-acid synthase [Prevotella sp.]|nr:2-succinyl-5-enolpyruvyl-6-hydroxy-3-cyclohexene-1-carboxylic-acid synthase [Prevotella sp.]
MYSNKENVNTLTALLVAHGVRHAVVCPGSRNAPIVHNLNECPDIACHPVTDERSAGFYALGMSQFTDEPVAVCVTSGTALLNLMPAVAEAYHQHVRLVVISADRPQAWIGQLDGQTLPQPGALGGFVAKSVSLPEPHSDDDRWLCNRLINEALIAAWLRRPVHINVPISEPLFQFDVERLSEERLISYTEPSNIFADVVENGLLQDFCQASRPMIVIGQYRLIDQDFATIIERLEAHCVVLYEALGHPCGGLNFDEVLHRIGNDERYVPDFLLYCGDTIVSKRLRHFLRRDIRRVWEITEDGEVHDTFQCVKGVVDGSALTVLDNLCDVLDRKTFTREYDDFDPTFKDTTAFVSLWHDALSRQRRLCDAFQPDFSAMAAVKAFEQQLAESTDSWYVHYANSSAIRLANIFARHFVDCNRGVNGIEGSLSTAAGFSLVADGLVFCVVGDLSFFYDQNALWNQELRGNLRILLLNNGCGGIFTQLPGLEQSPARDRLVAASHTTTAEGICRQNRVAYLSAHDMSELRSGISRLTHDESERPMLLEVFTDPQEDARVMKAYYQLD